MTLYRCQLCKKVIDTSTEEGRFEYLNMVVPYESERKNVFGYSMGYRFLHRFCGGLIMAITEQELK